MGVLFFFFESGRAKPNPTFLLTFIFYLYINKKDARRRRAAPFVEGPTGYPYPQLLIRFIFM